MEKEECWATFLESGKVTDYLNYCGAQQRIEENIRSDGEDGISRNGQKDADDRVKHNAGFY